MSKNQISFFATQNDLLQVLNDVKSQIPYVLSSQIEFEAPEVYASPEIIKDLGICTVGDQNQTKMYLLISPNDEPKTRPVEQRNGDSVVLYDQMTHISSVSFAPGGLHVDLPCIIAGQVGTISNDEWSMALYKKFALSIRKKFTKIKSFYVGREASIKLDEGFRLTANIRSPVEYDLTR
jgi:hypothetical protein